MSDFLNSTDILNDAPVEYREGLQADLAAFAETIDPSADAAETETLTAEKAHELVDAAKVRYETAVRRSLLVAPLIDKHDRAVWDAVWKTLKNDAGQFPKHWRDKQRIAEDLHHEAWIRITENIEKYKDTGTKNGLRNWLWKVTANVVTDWKRMEARRHTIAPMIPLTVNVDGKDVHVDELERAPNPWYRKFRTIGGKGFRGKKWALCLECDHMEPRLILSTKENEYSLECGHVRPKELPLKNNYDGVRSGDVYMGEGEDRRKQWFFY